MKKHSITAIMCAFAIMLMFASASQAKVYLDVYGTTFKKITIGVPFFKGEKVAGSSADMSEVLNRDLDLSGFFITAPASLIDKELLDEGVEAGCQIHILALHWNRPCLQGAGTGKGRGTEPRGFCL